MAGNAGMHGADTERLREVARRLDGASARVARVRGVVAAEVAGVEWMGTDADTFRARIDERVAPALDALAVLLEASRDELREQADEQDAASAARGGGGSGPDAGGGADTDTGTDTGAGTGASGRPLTPGELDALHALAGDPSAVAAALAALDPATLERLAREHPDLVGPLEGAPYWARDLANRERLADALAAAQQGGDARLADLRAIADVLASTPDASLPQLDLDDPARVYAAVALGDLDRAGNVTYLVPGITNTAASGLASLTGSAMNVRDELALAGTGELADYATVAWMGYDTGHVHTVPFNTLAERGAERLERTLDGFTAVRPDDTVELGVIGHSYGSTATALALADGDQHGVDRFIALGSAGFVHTRDTNGWWPGGREISPGDFGGTSVWSSEASADWVADIGRVVSGRLDPAAQGFSTFSSDADGPRLATTGHGLASDGTEVGYLGPGTTSLYSIGRILNGLE